MAQSRAESSRDTYNYGQYINQFPPNTIKAIREYERIQEKICRQKMSIMFNEICINEELLPKYTYIYRQRIYIYIYMYVCMYIYGESPWCSALFARLRYRSVFKLHLQYYCHFWTNALGKRMNLSYSPFNCGLKSNATVLLQG